MAARNQDGVGEISERHWQEKDGWRYERTVARKTAIGWRALRVEAGFVRDTVVTMWSRSGWVEVIVASPVEMDLGDLTESGERLLKQAERIINVEWLDNLPPLAELEGN